MSLKYIISFMNKLHIRVTSIFAFAKCPWIEMYVFQSAGSFNDQFQEQTYIYLCVCVCARVYFWASLVAQVVKNIPAVWETGFNPWVGKTPREENGYPLQYSCLENSMDRGAWWATVHQVAESDMTEQLTLLYVLIYSYALIFIKSRRVQVRTTKDLKSQS